VAENLAAAKLNWVEVESLVVVENLAASKLNWVEVESLVAVVLN